MMPTLTPPTLPEQLALCRPGHSCALVGRLQIDNQASARLVVGDDCIAVVLPFAKERLGTEYHRKHGRWNDRDVRLAGETLPRKPEPDRPGLIHAYSSYRGRWSEDVCAAADRVFVASSVRRSAAGD